MHYCYNLILQKFFYKFRAMKIHNKEVSCGIPALWYNIMTKYMYDRVETRSIVPATIVFPHVPFAIFGPE